MQTGTARRASGGPILGQGLADTDLDGSPRERGPDCCESI
jgi:hypothetical protein